MALPDVELVAAAGEAPRTGIEPGDWLVERALGEGAIASLRVLDVASAERAAAPRRNRIVVRANAQSRRAARFSPASIARFVSQTRRAVLGRSGKGVGRTIGMGEAIGGFVDQPIAGKIRVGRRGLFVHVGYDVTFIPGVDKGEQALAIVLMTLVGKSYSPMLGEEAAQKLKIRGRGEFDGMAKAGEIVGVDHGGFGMETVALGLELVRWLRDEKQLTLDREQFDDLRWRRLEHAVAVEDAWLQVFDQTQSGDVNLGALSRPSSAIFPPTHRYGWVGQSMFTAIAWSQGLLVEKARVAYLAFEAKPDSKYGSPEFDNRIAAIGALWNEFNVGADALDAIRRDAALRKHPGCEFLFPTDREIDPAAARLRFVELCLSSQRKRALQALQGRQSMEAARARKQLLDAFTTEFRIMLNTGALLGSDGEDFLRDQISAANAPPFPCRLAVSPKDLTLPSGGEMSAEINIDADHWTSLFDYHYWWDLLRVDQGLSNTSIGFGSNLKRRLGRQVDYTRTDFKRLKRELEGELGPPGAGALTIAGSLAIVRFAGTVVKDVLRAVFERPSQKTLALPGPGIYMLRCIAGDLHPGKVKRVQSADYWLFEVVPGRELSQRRAEKALQALREEATVKQPLLEAALASDQLEPQERTEVQLELDVIVAKKTGDAASLYAVQRKNLERAKSDPSVAAQISRDPAKVTKTMEVRIAVIDRIVAERKRRLGMAAGTPYRVVATLVTDLGPTVHLVIEAIDVARPGSGGDVQPLPGFDVLVIDSTEKHSGYQRKTGPTRLGAIRAALTDLLENSVTGYGRGWCTILVPSDGVTGLGEHDLETFRVDADTASMLNEMIEGGALIVSVLALLAAPFTGGASLALLIPMGVIGVIPSGYRLAKRYEEGTFAWDMETALDIVNIASGLVGLGQGGSGALKFHQLATAFKLTGHGSDGLGVILGTSQFFTELEMIGNDPNLLDTERRFALAMAVSTKLVNDGVTVGHLAAMHTYAKMMRSGIDPLKFLLPLGVLPDDYQLPPVHERSIPEGLSAASESIQNRVRSLVTRDIAVLLDPSLRGKSVEVRYVLDAYGFIDEVYLALGPQAGDAQLPSHAATVNQILKFTGVIGKARTLISWARAMVTKDPSHRVGKTRAWEVRLELEKLPKQVTDYMRSIGGGQAKSRDVDDYVWGLHEQLRRHESALRDASPGRGRIAAHDASATLSPREQAMRDGRQYAHIVTGIALDRIDVRDAPPADDHVRVWRAGDRLVVDVPPAVEGRPLMPDDIEWAIESHQDLMRRRPPGFPAPDPSRPWTADEEAEYQGRPKPEFGYHWELQPDGTLRYRGNDARFPARIFDPTSRTFGRDPTALIRPRWPVPMEFGPDYVSSAVQGLFTQAIDPKASPDVAFPGLQGKDLILPRGDTQYIRTVLSDGNVQGRIASSFTGSKAELSLDAHFINDDLPAAIATTPALLSKGEHAGKTPLAILATLRHMRQLGIRFGGLRTLVLHQIQHVTTVLEVHVIMAELGTTVAAATTAAMTPELASKLQTTALGKYGWTIAVQSGHVITGVEFNGVPRNRNLDALMTAYEHLHDRQSNPAKVRRRHDNLLRTKTISDGRGGFRKFERTGVVTTDFNIVYHLEDAP